MHFIYLYICGIRLHQNETDIAPHYQLNMTFSPHITGL